MRKPTEVDVLVAGQGLAGSAVAMQAVLAGMSVAIAEPERKSGQTASRVAAGLITPLTGKKINPGWRLDELLPVAGEFYQACARLLGSEFFHPCEIHRWFTGEDEYRSFTARWEDERVHRWCLGLLPPDHRVHAPWGGFAMGGGGWLDVPAWLDAIQARFRRENQWIDAAVDEADLVLADGYITWGDLKAGHVVFCSGLAASDTHRFFPHLPFRPASGEVLEIRLVEGPGTAVWNSGGKWIAPRPDGTCLCGATYGFGQKVSAPSAAGRRELGEFLGTLVSGGHQIIGHRAGVRPILHQSRPIAGFSDVHPRVAILNGLGSKGVLTAPWAAGQLMSAIRQGRPMDPELDPARLHRDPRFFQS